MVQVHQVRAKLAGELEDQVADAVRPEVARERFGGLITKDAPRLDAAQGGGFHFAGPVEAPITADRQDRVAAGRAVGGDRGDVTILAADTGEVRATLPASDQWVGGLAFSPDGRRLAIGAGDLSLWEVRDGALLARFAAGSARGLCWSRDGRFVACVVDNASAALLRSDGLEIERTFALRDDTAADSIALSPDGKRLAVGKRSGATQVFAVDSGELVETLEQEEWVQGLAWLDDGRLCRLGWRGSLWLFDAEPVAFGETTYGFAVARDGSRAAIRGSTRTAILRPDAAPIEVEGSGPVALHPDGERWARAVGDRVEVRRGREVVAAFPAGNRLEPDAAVLTGDGRFVAVAAANHLHVFDAGTGDALPVRGLPDGVAPVHAPNTPELVLWRPRSGDTPAAVEYWQLDRNGHRRVRNVELPIGGVDLHVDTRVPTLSADGRLLGYADCLFDLLEPAASVALERVLMCTVLPAPGGSWFLGLEVMWDCFGGGYAQVERFDRAGKPLAKRMLDAGVLDAALRSDGRRLALPTTKELLLLDSELQQVDAWDLSWHRVRWLDDRWLLGSDHEGRLFAMRLDAEAPEPGPLLELGSWTRTLYLNVDRTRAVAALADRVVLIGVGLPRSR
ncbi:MAG: hypothetical protein KDE27_29625 [Planctomycetes bacterium]|nr:hypothetical protein [Planctomycetota bacterium]